MQDIFKQFANQLNSIYQQCIHIQDAHDHSYLLTNSIDTSKMRYENLINSLQGFLDVVSANRAELFPPQIEPETPKKPAKEAPKAKEKEKDPDGLEPIDLSVVNVKAGE